MRIIGPIDISPALATMRPFHVQPDDPLVVQVEEPFQVASIITNVPADDYPAWAPGTYSREDRVTYQHRVYEVIAEETQDSPAEGLLAQPPTWLDMGPTNQWAMFDDRLGTVTSNPESIEVSMMLGEGVDSLALFGVDAGQVIIRVVDPYQGITFERTSQPSITDGIQDWYGYFFDPVEIREDFIVTGLNATRFSSIQISFLKPDGIAKVGALVAGKLVSLGVALYGTSIGIIDFSRKERDPFGNYIVVERDFSKRAEYDVAIDTAAVSRVQRLLAKYRARPLVWIGEESYESTIVYGYYREFSISISGPSVSDGTIYVEGLN